MKTDNSFFAVSSRIRFARNLNGYNFPIKIRGTNYENVITNSVFSVLERYGGYNYIPMCKLSDLQKRSLIERYIISNALSNSKNGAVFVSEDNTSIMVNEEDHIREQCILEGLNLIEAYKRLDKIDKVLSKNLNFVKNNLGFVTACPTNLGTGMRASVMVFLPALTISNQIQNVIINARRSGITIRGAFGEGSQPEGYLYQVSNSFTLNSAGSVVESVEDFVTALIQTELNQRYRLFEEDRLSLEDRCFRAFAILTNCKLLSYSEFLELYASIKLGASLEILNLERPSILDDLLVASRPATLKGLVVSSGNDAYDRACYVGKAIKLISGVEI